jgi:WD40 repeat protein
VLYVSPSEVLVASSQIELWDLRAGNLNSVAKFSLPQDGKGTPTRIWDLTSSSNVVAAGDSHGRISLFDIRGSSQNARLPFQSSPTHGDGHVWRVAFVPGTATLVSCSSDGQIVSTDFAISSGSNSSDFQRPRTRLLFDGYMDISDFTFLGGHLVATSDDSSLIFLSS